jgi:hypothetical protein
MRNVGVWKDGDGAALLGGELCQEHVDCAQYHINRFGKVNVVEIGMVP